MLNISELKIKPNLSKHSKKGNEIAQTRHYPPANKEWFNSIYAYNKNTIKLLPVADKVTLKVLRSYFNLYSPKLEKSVRSARIRRRLRRLSTNRILISRPELKHTTSKLVITVYIHNRQELYLLRKQAYTAWFTGAIGVYGRKYENIFNNIILNITKKKGLNLISKVYKQKKKLLKTLDKKINIFKSYENKYLKSFISKCLQKEIILSHYNQIISLNKSKFEKSYLLPLTGLVKNIYNKQIEFNLVNLKNLYLNSYIFSDTLVTKIRNKKNTVLRVLKASLRMFQLASLNNLTIFDDMYNRKKKIQNLKVNYLGLEKDIKGDGINDIKKEVYKKNFLNAMQMQSNKVQTWSTVLDSINNKSITGIRLEATGRLTRRNVAARSIHKLRYKGNLKNMDSSYKGFSSVLLRGHAKSNVQYTKLKSKRRIGSFGLKGWVSSN